MNVQNFGVSVNPDSNPRRSSSVVLLQRKTHVKKAVNPSIPSIPTVHTLPLTPDEIVRHVHRQNGLLKEPVEVKKDEVKGKLLKTLKPVENTPKVDKKFLHSNEAPGRLESSNIDSDTVNALKEINNLISSSNSPLKTEKEKEGEKEEKFTDISEPKDIVIQRNLREEKLRKIKEDNEKFLSKIKVKN